MLAGIFLQNGEETLRYLWQPGEGEKGRNITWKSKKDF
jgi:hypothetical protein